MHGHDTETAETADAAAAVLAAEDRRRVAVVAVDLQALDALFAEDLVHVHSTGLTHGKAELLRHIDRKRAFLAVDRGPISVRVEGDVAVLTGPIVNTMRTPDGGEQLLEGVVTQVLRREHGSWRFIHFQLTPWREPGRLPTEEGHPT